MANTQKYGKWEVEETLKGNRCYLATSEDGTKGAVKIGRGIEKEIEVLERLNHPNIITLLDYDLETEIPYMVTEYFDGRRRSMTADRKLSEATSLLLDVSEAMAYCIGKGVSINDVEILVNDQSEVRLIDFGSVRIIDRVIEIRKGLKQIHDKLDWMENNMLYTHSRRKQKKAELLS